MAAKKKAKAKKQLARKTASKKKPAKAKKPRKTATKKPATPAFSFPRTEASDGWRARLRAELDAVGPSFSAYLRGLGASGWQHADDPVLAGLERWGTELATRDLATGIAALVAAAQVGLPLAVKAGGSDLKDLGVRADEVEFSGDGLPVEVQLVRCAAWLDAPSDATCDAVLEAFDGSRQLQQWDDDVRPDDDMAFYWYLDAGQCCCAAILGEDDGDASRSSYHFWPAETCVGRGLVVCARGLRTGKDSATVIDELRTAMA